MPSALRSGAPRCHCPRPTIFPPRSPSCCASARPAALATTGLGNLPHDLAVRLLDIVGKDALPFDDAVNEVTAPKTDEEIEFARKAVAIAEQTHEHMLAVGHVGMRECDLAVEMNLFARGLGANTIS